MVPSPADLVTCFRLALREEAEAIGLAADRLPAAAIETALGLVTGCSGKLLFVGVGKSGHIARKIAATFSSLNVPSVFLHAAEAVHGDLGLLSAGDVVFLVSNSGETEELVALLPHLHRRSVSLIAIVGNPASTLARQATVVLDASVAREVCPLNLAPTASTSVALALGDALAATVARAKNLTRDEFAVNHPSGRLGKRLTLKVSDFLRPGERAPSLAASAPWREVVLALSEFRLGAVNVVDEAGLLLGLVTDGDLRRALTRQYSPKLEGLTAELLMTRSPLTVGPMTLAYEAMSLMNSRGDRGISVLPVVDARGVALGLLRLQDLVRSGI